MLAAFGPFGVIGTPSGRLFGRAQIELKYLAVVGNEWLLSGQSAPSSWTGLIGLPTCVSFPVYYWLGSVAVQRRLLIIETELVLIALPVSN